MVLGFLAKYRDAGLFVLRVGIGVCFIAHGWPKISNPDGWSGLGATGAAALGMSMPEAVTKALGFLAALAEFGGGICLILGFLFRPACILMAGNMAVALLHHVHAKDGFMVYSHALEMLIVFFSLIFIGPGKVSVERN